jgi:Zn-dependent metalloprotease
MKHAYFLALGAACACWPVLSHAQTGVLAKDTARNGAVTFMRLDTHATPKPLAEANLVLRTLLKLTPDDELRVGKQQQDELGYTHQWHTQYYRGIPVEYGTYVVHARNQVIETINGELIPVKNLKATPALDEKAALQKALANINATSYKWQVPTEEQWIKSIKKDANATFYPKGALLVTCDGEKSPLVRLAYKFAIYAVKPASSDYVYVDAHTGEVFQKTPIAQHTNSPGTAATRYSQTRTITTDAFAGGYRLRETGRGAGSACGGSGAPIETYNMQSGSSFGAAVDFVNGTNNWVSLNNSAKDNAALDAHWGAESTYDYFNAAHCRNSYTGSGSAIRGYVHANLVGLGYPNNDNAFWDPNLEIMVYGDGTSFFSPLTALDVVAHEIGHGSRRWWVSTEPSPRPMPSTKG